MSEGDDARIERVARAIYMTHWSNVDFDPALARPNPPVWENASEKVRDWVRAQAVSAIAATESVA